MFVELIVSGVAGVGVGIAHSLIGERAFLPAFVTVKSQSVSPQKKMAQRVLRGVWHLSSVAWIGLGGALLWVGFMGQVNLPLAVSATAIFGCSSAMNIIATQRLHIGGILLAVAAIFAALHPILLHVN